jgi:parvulin-like peptidyl-prolyl isomerase
MFKTKDVTLVLLATLAFGPPVACGQNQSGSTATIAGGMQTPPPESLKGPIATVNGTVIGDEDIRAALSGGAHDKELPSQHRKNVLDAIIQRELARQKAVELGLDSNGKYQEKLRRMEAQLNAFKRRELSELFWQETAGKVEISEAEAEKYFKENASRIRTEFHVWQILGRKEGLIERSLKELEQGKPFDEVARKRFPKLPKSAGTPWDLGYLRWKQVPEAWQGVVDDLEKGEVSGVIRGPNNRFWIIKLIDKRENPDITFESIKPTIMEVLKNAKIEKLRKQVEEDLRAKANIVHSRDPVESREE